MLGAVRIKDASVTYVCVSVDHRHGPGHRLIARPTIFAKAPNYGEAPKVTRYGKTIARIYPGRRDCCPPIGSLSKRPPSSSLFT